MIVTSCVVHQFELTGGLQPRSEEEESSRLGLVVVAAEIACLVLPAPGQVLGDVENNRHCRAVGLSGLVCVDLFESYRVGEHELKHGKGGRVHNRRRREHGCLSVGVRYFQRVCVDGHDDLVHRRGVFPQSVGLLPVS